MSPVKLLTERFDLAEKLWCRHGEALAGICFKYDPEHRRIYVRFVWPDDGVSTLSFGADAYLADKTGRQTAYWLIDQCNLIVGQK